MYVSQYFSFIISFIKTSLKLRFRHPDTHQSLFIFPISVSVRYYSLDVNFYFSCKWSEICLWYIACAGVVNLSLLIFCWFFLAFLFSLRFYMCKYTNEYGMQKIIIIGNALARQFHKSLKNNTILDILDDHSKFNPFLIDL